MTKRRVLTSVVASTVLAGVLALSGCGGSSNGNNINTVDQAKGTATINAALTDDITIPVQGRDSTGKSVVTAEVKLSKDAAGIATDCTTTSPCSVQVVQSSVCANTVSTDNVTRANDLRADVLDADGKIILFAGDITITEASGKLTSTGMEVTVKLPTCALSPVVIPGQYGTHESDGKHKVGVASCDTMKIYVETPNGAGAWVDGYISSNTGCGVSGSDQYVTFSITGVPKNIFIFALRTPPAGYTGSTGATGAGGY